VRRLPVPHLNTLHGPLTAPDRAQLYRRFHQLPLVSISEAQRQPLPGAHWLATVYHGLPLDLYDPVFEPDDYLAFVGRISPEKRLDRAIAIAGQLGLPLKVAAKIDNCDAPYYRDHIADLIEGNPLVEFIGEVDDAGKQELLGNALALLFPIDWAEPFGLVMIEANACGTPVIAWRNGSTPEVIRPDLNGVLVDSIAEAVAAVRQLDRLDRRAVRHDFEQRFSVTRQAEQYEQLYRRLIDAYADPAVQGGNRPLHRPCPPRDPLLHAA
jgi:glycosyltransferase involved in cell wall biosynthesis